MMRRLLLTVLLAVDCAPTPPQQLPFRQFGADVDVDAVPLVSMVSLLADPEKFDAQEIRVHAVLHLEFEGDRLCLDRDSALDLVPKNCVRLALLEAREEEYEAIKHYNGQYVLVAGSFQAPDRRSLYSGRLAATLIAVNLPTSR